MADDDKDETLEHFEKEALSELQSARKKLEASESKGDKEKTEKLQKEIADIRKRSCQNNQGGYRRIGNL